jgi:threonine synthase
MSHFWPGLIRNYVKYFSIKDEHIVTLNEGNTPLIKSQKLIKDLPKGCELYFKYEGLNPTGSFKDRGMTYAISKAVEAGSRAVICASTGNTSASAAAYSARAGLKCIVLIPEGKIALGKLSQAMMHGATVLSVKGNFDDCLKLVIEISKTEAITLVNSVNPYRIEGQKTGAFEIVDQLGFAPNYHFIPVGNAGNITAYWKGYKEYQSHGKVKQLPKMMGYQAAGAAPIVLGHVVEKPETVATAIRIGNPASWQGATAALKESEGAIDSVTDSEILSAYKRLAKEEGVFCEPASAASVAGLLKYKKNILPNSKIVCILTGHGLKDPDNAISESSIVETVSADKEAILKKIKG